MTHREHILEAISHLNRAIYTFPDKEDMIRRTNDVLDGIISMLAIIINDLDLPDRLE